MCEVGGEAVSELLLDAVLFKVSAKALLALAPHAPAVNVAAPCDGAKVGTCDGEGASTGEGVIEQLSWTGEGNVGRDERQLGVHASCGDVLSLLEVVFENAVPG